MRSSVRLPHCLVLTLAAAFQLFGIIHANAQLGGNPFSKDPSFGLLNKRTVSLRSKLPPIYNASGKTIGISSGDAVLTIAIEKQLTQTDTSIRVGESNPDLLIECSVSQSSPVHDVKTSDSNGSVDKWEGDLSIIFRISEPRSRQVVKSGIAEARIEQVNTTTSNATPAGKVFGMKTPASGPTTTTHRVAYTSTAEAQNAMIDDVARKIASYLVNTEHIVVVPLAVGGALNNPNKLVDSGLWPRYLEALETIPPYPDAKVDAYRLYDIGVANEAMAYQAEDNKSAIKDLELASNNYGKAFDAKPQEKGFIEAQDRIKTALQYYSEIGKTTPLSGATPLQTSIGAPAAAPGALTNKDVIDMVAAHMDDANILDNIQNARDVDFDISVKAQIALKNAGVKPEIIMAIKNRARGITPQQRRR